jgi:hypothetical protein
MMNYDFTRIGDVLDALYTTLSGPAGDRDWDVRHQFFHPDAKLIRTGVDENGVSWLKIMNLDEYREDVAYAFKIVPFYEIELERRVEQFGNIAHAWSLYEERRDPNAPEIERRGINSIQLFRDSNRRWRILSIVWDNEREGVKLPE